MFGDNEKVMFKHHPSLLSSLLLQSIGIAQLQLFYRRKQQTKLIDDVKQNQIGNKYLMQTWIIELGTGHIWTSEFTNNQHTWKYAHSALESSQ